MQAQLFAASFAISLLSLGFLALLLQAVASLFQTQKPSRRIAASQVVVSFTGVLGAFVAAMASVVSRSVFGVLRWWAFFLFIFVGFSMAYVTYEEYPQTWLGFAAMYNTYVGPWVRYVVIIPLMILDLLLRALLPVWNTLVWVLKSLLWQGFFPTLVREAEQLYLIAGCLVDFAIHFSLSFSNFLRSFGCQGSACLLPEQHVMDLITPVQDLRKLSVHVSGLLRVICSTLAAPLDVLGYPFLDFNLALAVHNLFNAWTHLMIAIPQKAVERCMLSDPASPYHLMMCTPDFTPFWNLLVAGIGNVGILIDNWANVAFLVVQQALTGYARSCDPVELGMIPSAVAAADAFGGRPTVVVGLTEWMYAVTDGATAVYFGGADLSARSQLWPFPVDVALGVAAVVYSSSNQLDVGGMAGSSTRPGALQTTGMMGCNCTDTSSGPQILCAVLPISGVPSSVSRSLYRLEARFPDSAVQAAATCRDLDIYVTSSRFPFTRYDSGAPAQGQTDCISRGTCREVDATVWVMPRCGMDRALSPTLCAPTASCFPFCMAARPAGSGAVDLLLAPARRWREGFTILNQDCVIFRSQNGAVSDQMGSSGAVSTAVAQGTLVTNGIFAVGESNRSCSRAPGVVSIVDKTPSEFRANALVRGQPFVFTGDTVLTARDLGGGFVSVAVERLAGNERNIFSMETLNQDLPAEPPVLRPVDEEQFQDSTRVLVPYAYQTTRVVAVTSRNYLFYASNPASEAFGAYFQFCADLARGSNSTPQFGWLLKSSYAPIRIYRVAAYRRCSRYSCGPDLTSFATIPGFVQNFSRACDQSFNAQVTSLEYLNEDNIAVTVLVANVTAYDGATGTFQGVSRTLWLNPATMQVQDAVFQGNTPTTSLTALCPQLQRLPRLGTFLAEGVSSVVFLAKFAIGAILYTPAMIPVWRTGSKCPAFPGGTLYHAVLADCGDDVYSLSDYFDALADANTIFWHSLVLLQQLVTPTQVEDATPLDQIFQGMAGYGEGVADIWTQRASVVSVVRLPLRETAQGVWAFIQSGGARYQVRPRVSTTITAIVREARWRIPKASDSISRSRFVRAMSLASWAILRTPSIVRFSARALSVITTGGLDFPRFCYDALSRTALSVVKVALSGEALSSDAMWVLLWSKLYDMQPEFKSTVNGNMQACAGLRLMLGGANPWADFVYYQCASAASLMDDAYRFLMVLFVEIPMAKCVCVDSAGKEIVSFVATRCTARLPLTLAPTMFMIARQAAGYSRVTRKDLACRDVLAFVQARVRATMDSWFDAQHKSLEALGGAVDYFMTKFDDRSGDCENFRNDPHVVVIVPYPTDYFQRCGGTSHCKRACQLEWDQFKEVVKDRAALPLPAIEAKVESLFFPGTLDPQLELRNATASFEMTSEAAGCVARGAGVPDDYAVAVAESFGPTVSVQFWCAPRFASGTLYRSSFGSYSGSVPGDLLQAAFVSPRVLAMLVMLENSQQLCVLRSSGAVDMAPAVVLPPKYDFVRLSEFWAVEGLVLVDVVVRGFLSDRTYADMLSFTWDPAGNATWARSVISFTQFGGERYQYTRLAPLRYLFIPSYYGFPAFNVILSELSGALVEVDRTSLSSFTPITGLRLASSSLSPGYVFGTSTVGWDWLRQVRLAASGALMSVRASAEIPITVQVQGHCDEVSCEGCPDVATQRFCLGYNRCALTKCVGTSVNQRRPLCGLGGLLRTSGTQALTSVEGAFRIVAEMLCQIIDVSFRGIRVVQVDWPEDAFLTTVCVAKDANAHLFSVVTSFINAAMQLGKANVGYMYQAGSAVDKGADSILTITTTAMTSFMHQIFILPLYLAISAHQVFMCTVGGVVALLDSTGFKIIVSSVNTENQVAGQCLTVGTEFLTRYPTGQEAGVARSLQSFVYNAVNFYIIKHIEPMVHFIEAVISWAIGVVRSLAVLLMSQYPAKCNPPNLFLRDVVRCACNDQRLWIPAPQRTTRSDHWCKGALSMADANNRAFVVYNPFTFDQLAKLSAGLQAYLDCVAGSSGYSCAFDSPPVFQEQGVSTLNVLVRCRDNYMKRRWDPAAYLLTSVQYLDRFHGVVPQLLPEGEVRDCLAAAGRGQASVDDCATLHATSIGVSLDDYWAVERSPLQAPEYTDACLVFSGAAANNFSSFQKCVDGPEMGACNLPQNCWSPTSANNVPVCERHRLLSHGLNPDGLVQRLFAEASSEVLQAIDEAEALDLAKLNVDFFSVEGDVIHQTMDCMFLGPYARVDYWPMPPCAQGEECLAGPSWSRDRDGGASRSVDPYACDAESELPYTCGSPARRAVIRYLVRDVVTGNNSDSNIRQVLNMTLRELRDDWSDVSRFWADAPAYLPPNLSKPFTYLSSEKVMESLRDDFRLVHDRAIETTAPWLEYGQPYDWSANERVKEEARFDPTRPVYEYDTPEAASPMRSSLWDTCHAALKQVFFTLPVNDAGEILGALAYDGNTSRLEEFVRLYTERAMLRSPLYWHYHPRHAPSQSKVFRPNATAGPTLPAGYKAYAAGGTTILPQDDLPAFQAPSFHAFALGTEGACLCGWPSPGPGLCKPPSADVCNYVACDAELRYLLKDQASGWDARERFIPRASRRGARRPRGRTAQSVPCGGAWPTVPVPCGFP